MNLGQSTVITLKLANLIVRRELRKNQITTFKDTQIKVISSGKRQLGPVSGSSSYEEDHK